MLTKRSKSGIDQQEIHSSCQSRTIDMVILILLSVVTVLLLLLYYPLNAEKRRAWMLLEKIPGPYQFLYVVKVMFQDKNDLMVIIENVLREYGPLFSWRFGLVPFVNVSKPEYIEVVLRNTQMIDKSFIYKFLHSWLGDGLLTSTGAKWHTQRKIITPTFHFSILEGFVDIFAEKADILVKKLKEEQSKDGLDAYPFISRCALDIICETAMGTSINAQINNSSEYVTAIYKMTDVTSIRFAKPLYQFDFIYNLSTSARVQKNCLKVICDFVNQVIQERKEKRLKSKNVDFVDEDSFTGRKKRKAFLDMLLDASESGNALTDEEIRDEVHTFMFEGHDTVSAAMNWTLFELGQNPDIQETVYQELEEIFGDSNRAPTMNDLQNMNYLERVIKETLRLHPSVIYIARKARNDFELGGYTIPAGTNIDFAIFYIHKNPEYFPNPEKFDPDHFLPERVVNRHPYAYIPFSAGPRNCVGQRFALLEEKTILSYILRNFQIRTVTRKEDVNIKFDMINRPVDKLLLQLTPRTRRG